MTRCKSSFYLKSVVYLIVIILSFGRAKGLKCYICGTQTEESSKGSMRKDPCQEKDPTHEMYFKTCAPESVCTKMITYWGDQVLGVMRACTRQKMLDGRIHPTVCGDLYTDEDVNLQTAGGTRDVTCFCDTDFCNKSSLLVPHMPYIFIMACTPIFFILFNQN